MSKLLYDAARARYVPAKLPPCEGAKHHAPRMYLGVDSRWYVGQQVQARCPSCGEALPT